VPRRSAEDGVKAEQKLEVLAEGDWSPFYVLFGKERYFVRKGVALLKQRFLQRPDSRELLYNSVYGQEVNGVELVDLARSVPFFEQARLVVVWEAENLREQDRKTIQEYAEDPAPFTCMVFVVGEEVPKGTLFEFLRGRYREACLGFPGLKRAECLKWLEGLAKDKGIGPGASPDLLEGLLSGGQTSLESLEKQVEILALYFQDIEEARRSEPLPFGLPEISLTAVYRLTDPLLQGEVDEALGMVSRFCGQGVPPLLLLSRIAGEIRKLWKLKEEIERGSVTDSFLKSLRIPAFKQRTYAALARRLSWRSLGKMFFALGETDRLLKSSRLDPLLHLEGLCQGIVRLVQGESDSRADRPHRTRTQ
jgi:DNA polymerase III subunit delta